MPPWLATSTLPSATSEVAKSRITGRPPGCGIPMQTGAVENRRSTPPNGATSTEPVDIDEMHRDQPGFRRHLRPFADTPDMAGIAQADGGQTMRPAFLDPERDRLRCDGLAETELAVENRNHRCVDHPFHDAIREQTGRRAAIARSAARARRRGCHVR